MYKVELLSTNKSITAETIELNYIQIKLLNILSNIFNLWHIPCLQYFWQIMLCKKGYNWLYDVSPIIITIYHPILIPTYEMQ